MHSHDVDYPVYFVILINLVGDNFVEDWSIPPLVLKQAVVLISAHELSVRSVSVGDSRRELGGLVVITCWQSG